MNRVQDSGSAQKSKKAKRPPSMSGQSPPPSASEAGGVDLTKVRAYSACKSCRAKKIKCLPSAPPNGQSSVENPNPGPCQQCLAAGLECTYPPTRDRAAYSRQYVQNLESRVQALEMMNGRLGPLLHAFEQGSLLLPEGAAGQSIRPKVEPIPMSVPVNGEGDGEGDGDEDEEDPDSPPEDTGHLTTDERGNYRWVGASNTISLLDSFNTHPDPIVLHQNPSPPGSFSESPSISSAAHPNPNPYFGPVAGAGVVNILPTVDEVSFPSPRAAAEMVDAFFADLHPCLPLVVEHEFREDFARIMEKRRRGEPLTSHGGLIAVLFAIFALGERVIVTSRAWQRERARLHGQVKEGQEETVMPGEAEAGVIWYERAMILHYTTMKDVDIHQVQCLTLLAAFQASVNAMPQAWLLAGQAMRIAQDLGIHRSWARQKLSFKEKQIRARIWWAIYGLERMVSIALGRPLGVDDLDIDVSLPAEIDDDGLAKISKDNTPQSQHDVGEEPHGSTMSGFVALTKLCKIAGKVAHVLYRPSNRSMADPAWATAQQATINKLDKALRDWLSHDVASKYKDPSANHKVQIVSAVLSNSYFAILITLHRNFLPPNPDFPRPQPVANSQSLSHCVDAARSVIHVAAQSRVLVPPSHHMAVFCQYLWSSAVILLLCEVQAREQVVVDAVGSQVESCRRSLQTLEPVWPGSRRLKDLLNDVEKRAKEMVNQPRTLMPPVIAKKRKAGSFDKKQSTFQTPDKVSSRWGPPSTDPKRQRIDSPRYETSDTRTSMSHGGQNFNMNQTYQSIDPMSINPALFDPGFDVGGVAFEGLEMLQGFSGFDPNSIWSALSDTLLNTSPQTHMNNLHSQTPQMPGSTGSATLALPSTSGSAPGSGPGTGGPGGPGGPGQGGRPGFMSNQGTPTSNASQTGPSPGPPGTWAIQHQHGVTNGGTGMGTGLDANELWNQVAGGSFDWAADPNVPFHI